MSNPSGYSNVAFHKARQDPDGYPARHCEPSWADQTHWAVNWANEAVESEALRDAINREVTLITNVSPPSLRGFEPFNIKNNVTLGGTTFTFCPVCGAIVGMVDLRGVQWSGPDNPLALFEYTLYTNEQMAQLRAEYCPNGCNPKEFGKPGMPLNTSVNATATHPELWVKKDPSGHVVEIISAASMDRVLNSDYGEAAFAAALAIVSTERLCVS
eukprot:COSAG01_NODE_9282_length_2495_cov_1.679466_4_plen_214_part_00